MPSAITDPLSRRGARVDKAHRLEVRATNEPLVQQHTVLGRTYSYQSGTVTLTDANENAIAYLKNNEDQDLIISTIAIAAGNSTSGTGDLLVTIDRNPTGGTLFDDGSAATLSNFNFGSTNILSVDAFKATANGKTLTGGTRDVFRFRRTAPMVIVAQPAATVRLPKGASIGIFVTAPASNTSMAVDIGMNLRLDDGTDVAREE